MKKGRRNAIVSAVLGIVMCLSLAVGATFALFQVESDINIAVGSANVSVTATISNLSLTSPAGIAPDGTIVDSANAASDATGTFASGGTAKLDGNKLVLDRMAPGDGVTFDITVVNNSNIDVYYRTKLDVRSDNGLFGKLKVTVAGMSASDITDWKLIKATDAKTPQTFGCSV